MKKILFSISLFACSFFLGKYLGYFYSNHPKDELSLELSNKEFLEEQDVDDTTEINDDDEEIILKKNLTESKMDENSIKEFILLYEKNQDFENNSTELTSKELEPFKENLDLTLSSLERLIELQKQDDSICEVALKLVSQLPFQEEQQEGFYKKAIFLPPILDTENPGIQFSYCFDLSFDYLKKIEIRTEKMDQLIQDLLAKYPTEIQTQVKNYLIDLEVLPDPEEDQTEEEDENKGGSNSN